MDEKYVVIAEHKAEEPLAWETNLMNASYEEADKKMKRMLDNPKIVRVAVAKLVYVSGNKSLLGKEQSDEN